MAHRHSSGEDELARLSKRDKTYTHLVRGDEIALIFAKPKIALEDNQKESYILVSSGFYHGLRTYLYPDVDTSNSYKEEIKKYVNRKI